MHLQYSTWSYRGLIYQRNATTKADWLNQGILTFQTLCAIGAYNDGIDDADGGIFFVPTEGVARNGVGQHRTIRFDGHVCTMPFRPAKSYEANGMQVHTITLNLKCEGTPSNVIHHNVIAVV